MKKNFLILAMSVCMIVSAQSFSRFRTTALDSAAQKVNQGFTSITNINIAYPGTTIVYVKFYDSYAHAYAKAQSPVYTVQLGTDAALSYSLKSFSNLYFLNGLWVRCVSGITDTAQSQVQPSVKPILEIAY